MRLEDVFLPIEVSGGGQVVYPRANSVCVERPSQTEVLIHFSPIPVRHVCPGVVSGKVGAHSLHDELGASTCPPQRTRTPMRDRGRRIHLTHGGGDANRKTVEYDKAD